MNKFLVFILINSFLSFLGISFYYLTTLYNNFLILYFLYLVKTTIILFTTRYLQKNKEYITNRSESNSIDSYLLFTTSMLIETSTHHLITTFHQFKTTNLFFDFITFIPISLLFELIYDFQHYWIHRLVHTNKTLYKHLHKVHHYKVTTTFLDTYYQHPIDLIISNSIPFIISILLLNQLTYLHFCLITIYKTAVEIAGHTGKKTFPTSSFPQFPWLIKYFNMELYTEDHDLHHRHLNCNYAKRLSIWDKLFGTYNSTIPKTIALKI